MSEEAGPSPREGKQELKKVTFYLRPEDVLRLEEIRVTRLRAGQRVDKSALVREAIQLLQDDTRSGG